MEELANEAETRKTRRRDTVAPRLGRPSIKIPRHTSTQAPRQRIIKPTKHRDTERTGRRAESGRRSNKNKKRRRGAGEEAAPDSLAIKKLKVWWYTFSEGSAPLSFSDRLNKGRYQSCHGLSGGVGTKNVTNQSCLCVHVDVNIIKWKNVSARPAHAKISLVIVKIKMATRKR